MTNRPLPQLLFYLAFTCIFVVVSSSHILTTYRPRLLADGTGWPCSRESPHFALHLRIRYPPLPAQVENAFVVSLSLAVYFPRRFSVWHVFFFYNRTIHLLYYITRKSWSQNFLLQPRPVPSPRQTTKKGGDLRPPFLSLAYGIGIQLTNVLSSSAEQKGCMGLTLSRNGWGRRGGNISRIP